VRPFRKKDIESNVEAEPVKKATNETGLIIAQQIPCFFSFLQLEKAKLDFSNKSREYIWYGEYTGQL